MKMNENQLMVSIIKENTGIDLNELEICKIGLDARFGEVTFLTDKYIYFLNIQPNNALIDEIYVFDEQTQTYCKRFEFHYLYYSPQKVEMSIADMEDFFNVNIIYKNTFNLEDLKFKTLTTLVTISCNVGDQFYLRD